MTESAEPGLGGQKAPADGRSGASVAVWDYLDYHVYLRDWVESERERRPVVNYQWLATRSGFKSRSFLRLVALGEKNLPALATHRVSEAMGHDDAEAAFFACQVALGNARTARDREHHLERLRSIPRPGRSRILGSEEFELFHKWYIPALRELAPLMPDPTDWEGLSLRLDPAIRPDEAREGVRTLVDLGLLVIQEGRYVQAEAHLATSTRLGSRLVRDYQARTMELAASSLQRHPREHRHISTLTLGIDGPTQRKLAERIRAFRQEVLAMAAESGPVDRVCQLNVQLFPLTQLAERPDNG
jgi:uncharacterized protein (TIGR02147 family)